MNPSRSSPGSTRRTLDLLAGIALAHGAWSGWLWWKLVEARRGGAVSCALGGTQCAQVWDSSFASAVQDWSFLPVAAWGVVWSAVALALPLALRRRGEREREGALWIATLAVAALGLVAIAVLAAVMLRARATCSDCLLSYALVLAYGAVALRHAVRPAKAEGLRAAGVLLASGVAAYLLALYPGLRTPPPAAQAALETLRDLPVPAGGSGADRQLAELLRSLAPDELQKLADELARYGRSAELPVRPPRALLGSRTAPVRLIEFVDLQCSHCAGLHQALGVLRERLGPDAFALETRYFPLDASCNPHVPGPSRGPVRCTAARVMICGERQPWAFELAGKIFAAQERLDEALLYELASPWVSRPALEACVRSAATDAHLRDDVDWAAAQGIEGTPLVLVNGRKASAWPIFLMTIVLARGSTDHPLLAHLPPSRIG